MKNIMLLVVMLAVSGCSKNHRPTTLIDESLMLFRRHTISSCPPQVVSMPVPIDKMDVWVMPPMPTGMDNSCLWQWAQKNYSR